MRILLIWLVFMLTASAAGSAAQSRPSVPSSDRKATQRPAQPAPTQTPTRSRDDADDDEIIKVSTQLVSLPVRVMDKEGRFIGGLTKENFRVFENGVEQQVDLFSNELEPFTVALVLDMSYSTTFKIAEIQTAAIAFIEQLRPQDRVMVVSFDAEIHLLCEPTSDRREIYRAIKATKISDGTSLYEAVDLVINNRLRQIDGRKAIILFTDGVDTTSRRADDVVNLSDAMELDALIYPVQYDTFSDVQKMKSGTSVGKPPPITAPTSEKPEGILPILIRAASTPASQGTTPEEYEKAGRYLEQLATRTGGRLYSATTLGNLADAYAKIASELREFYSIGYYPSADRIAGKDTTVKVKVDRDGLVVRSRELFIRRKKNN